jgi:hypothetical protein
MYSIVLFSVSITRFGSDWALAGKISTTELGSGSRWVAGWQAVQGSSGETIMRRREQKCTVKISRVPIQVRQRFSGSAIRLANLGSGLVPGALER